VVSRLEELAWAATVDAAAQAPMETITDKAAMARVIALMKSASVGGGSRG